MPQENANRIGLGVGLEGGQSTLETLRDIRREMKFIADLSQQVKTPRYSSKRDAAIKEQEDINAAQGRLFADGIARQGVLFGQEEQKKTRIVEEQVNKRRGIRKSVLSEEERDEQAHQRRIDKLRQENNYSQQTGRNEASPAIAAKIEAERKANIQAESEAANRRIRDEKYFVESFNRRKQLEAQEANDRVKHEKEINEQIAADKLAAERTAATNRRSINAKDEDAELAALREANRVRQSASTSGSKRGLDTSEDRAKKLADSRRSIEEANFNAEVANAGRKSLDTQRDKLINYQNTLGRSGGGNDVRELQQDFKKLQTRAFELRAELDKPVSVRRSKDEIVKDLKDVENEFRRAESEFRRFREVTSGGGSGSGITPPGGPGGPGGRPAFNEKGFFTSGDVIARISRNILLYQAVSQTTYGLVDYIKTGIEAARTADDFGRALEFASKASKTNTENNFQLADSLRNLGASRQEGRAAVTEGARFVEGIDTDPTKLVNIAANIAASRGDGIDKTDELIEQLRRGESKFFKRQFGKTVEELYREEGERKAIPDNSVRIEDSKSGIKTDTEAVTAYVAALSEAQKERIRYNFILSQAGRFEGEAAKRSNELAGQLDIIANRFKDGQEGVGQFIAEINVLKEGLGVLVTLFDSLAVSSSRLKKTGSGGLSTDSDIAEFVRARTQGTRANALSAIDNFAVPAIAGTIGISALALYGRRQARTTVKNQAFDTDYQKGLIDFDQDTRAATARAKQVAGEAKPGLVRSVTTGLNRVTNGLNETLDNTFNTINNAVKGRTTGKGLQVNLNDLTRPSNKQYFEDKDAVTAIKQEGARKGGLVGGVLGGAVGAEIGNLIAKSIDAGPITTTGITVIGGIVGSAVGTAVGQVVGDGITGVVKKVAVGGVGIGVRAVGQAALTEGGLAAAGTALEAAITPAVVGLGALAAGLTGIGIAIVGYTSVQRRIEENNLKAEELTSKLFAERVGQLNLAKSEGRVLYNTNRKEDAGRDFTPEQVRDAVASGFRTAEDFQTRTTGRDPLTGEQLRDRYGNLVKIIAENVRVLTQAELELQQAHQKFIGRSLTTAEQQEKDTIIAQQNDEHTRGIFVGSKQLSELTRIENGTAGVGTGDDILQARGREYDLKQEQDRKAREDSALQARINDQSQALAKLRETSQGSFRSVEDVATGLSGGDNNFTKILSDDATLIGRMNQQWGYLGDKIKIGNQSAAEFFTSLEKSKNETLLINEQFASLGRKQELNNKRERESIDRNAPGLSSRQVQGNTITQAIIEAVKTQGQSAQRTAEISGGFLGFNAGFNTDPVQFAKRQVSQLSIQGGLGGFGNGGSSREVDEAVSAAIEEALGGLSSQQIRNDPYLKDAALRNARTRTDVADSKVRDEIAKARIISQQEDLTKRNLAEGRDLFGRQLGSGVDRTKAQDAFDKFNISSTDGIPVKDLTLNQFELRQESLKRQAESEGRKEAEAKANVEKGLAYQAALVEILGGLRQDILGGNGSIVIQVLNDTLARIDQEALQGTTSPGFTVPLNDTSRKSSPYSSLNDRYGSHGNKR